MSIRMKSATAGSGESEPVLPTVSGTRKQQLYAPSGITVRDMPYIVRHLHAPRPLLRLFREILPTVTLSPSNGHEATQSIHSSSSTPRLRGGGRGKWWSVGGRACVDPLPRPTGANPGQPHLIPANPGHVPDTASCVVRDLQTLSGHLRIPGDSEPVEWIQLPVASASAFICEEEEGASGSWRVGE